MSADPVWPVLTAHERRVLGVLVEKAKTTPDAYPLTLNALVTGCNQKSNRDPILNLTDLDVEDALTSAQKRGLVMRITGSRVERWRHYLYETWHVDKKDLAILAELLLRGPQTEGELRTRASRMEPLESLEELRAVLKPLAERKLVVYLTPEGRRGTMVTHGFHDPKELERIRAKCNAEPLDEGDAEPVRPASPVSTPRLVEAVVPPEWEQRWQEMQSELGQLRQEVTQLRTQVQSLAEQLREVRQGLGL